jgi:hypothetical protein
MAHTYTHLLTHIIFSTKDRAPLLDAGLKERLFPYLGGIIRAHDGKALIINGPATTFTFWLPSLLNIHCRI